jgi:hypothetical protein
MRSTTAYGLVSGKKRNFGESGYFGIFGSIGYAMGAMDVALMPANSFGVYPGGVSCSKGDCAAQTGLQLWP